MDAINDAFLLESSVYRMLKKYCGQQPYYVHLLELFLQVRPPGSPRLSLGLTHLRSQASPPVLGCVLPPAMGGAEFGLEVEGCVVFMGTE